MRATRRCLIGFVVAVAATIIGIVVAPSASADCVDSGNVTVCAQGEVRDGGPSAGSSTGPYYPYDCQDDWMCSSGAGVPFYGGGCTTPYGTYQNCIVQQGIPPASRR